MNKVAQSACLAQSERLPVDLMVRVPPDGDGERPLAQEGLVSCWHGS